MPILYTVISRGSAILAQYAGCSGNFTDVTQQVLSRISSDSTKMTYSHGEYLFHYVCDKGIVYLCITDNAFERSKAFNFLQYIKKKFEVQYGERARTALPYAMNTDFSQILKSQMRHISASGSVGEADDKFGRVQNEVNEVKGILIRNIDELSNRGEKLELLIDKTEELNTSSMTFKTKSKNLSRSMWWKNAKITIISVIIIIIVLYIIVSIACGGLGWQKCVKKK